MNVAVSQQHRQSDLLGVTMATVGALQQAGGKVRTTYEGGELVIRITANYCPTCRAVTPANVLCEHQKAGQSQ